MGENDIFILLPDRVLPSTYLKFAPLKNFLRAPTPTDGSTENNRPTKGYNWNMRTKKFKVKVPHPSEYKNSLTE